MTQDLEHLLRLSKSVVVCTPLPFAERATGGNVPDGQKKSMWVFRPSFLLEVTWEWGPPTGSAGAVYSILGNCCP